jgi:hypothetical protein
MALTILTGSSQAAGVNYSYSTSGSADWASVPTASYFYDIIDKTVRYKTTNSEYVTSLTSSTALTASYALSAQAFPFTGSALITGSLGVTGSFSVSSSIGTLLSVSSSQIVINGPGSTAFTPSIDFRRNGTSLFYSDEYGVKFLSETYFNTIRSNGSTTPITIIPQSGTGSIYLFPGQSSIALGFTTANANLDIRAKGALSTDLALRVRNSANDRNLFSILGNGDIEVRTNRVSLNQSTRLSIGGSNTDNGLDAVGYTENTIVGFNNTNTGRRGTIIGSSNTINNAGTNACTTVGYGNSNRENGVVVGHSNTLGGIVLGTGNIGGGVGRTAVIGDNNSVSVANGNPGQPMFLLGNGVTLPNLSAINNCVFLSAGSGSGNPFVTIKNDNLLIGTLTPWTSNFDNNSRGVFYTQNGTAPTTLATDTFGMYSADITAGNAAPHFRTENGSIIKLYKEIQPALSGSANTGDPATNALIEAMKTIILNLGLGASS